MATPLSRFASDPLYDPAIIANLVARYILPENRSREAPEADEPEAQDRRALGAFWVVIDRAHPQLPARIEPYLTTLIEQVTYAAYQGLWPRLLAQTPRFEVEVAVAGAWSGQNAYCNRRCLEDRYFTLPLYVYAKKGGNWTDLVRTLSERNRWETLAARSWPPCKTQKEAVFLFGLILGYRPNHNRRVLACLPRLFASLSGQEEWLEHLLVWAAYERCSPEVIDCFKPYLANRPLAQAIFGGLREAPLQRRAKAEGYCFDLRSVDF
jgi:hypothetical protein